MVADYHFPFRASLCLHPWEAIFPHPYVKAKAGRAKEQGERRDKFPYFHVIKFFLQAAPEGKILKKTRWKPTMKSILSTLLGLHLISALTLAQDQTPPPRPLQPSVEEQSVVAAEQARLRALLGRDSAALNNLIDEDYLQVTSTGDLRRKGHIVNGIKNGTISYKRLVTDELTVAIHDRTAVVTGRTMREGKDGKRDLSGTFRFIRTWAKKDGEWILIAQAINRPAKPMP